VRDVDAADDSVDAIAWAEEPARGGRIETANGAGKISCGDTARGTSGRRPRFTGVKPDRE